MTARRTQRLVAGLAVSLFACAETGGSKDGTVESPSDVTDVLVVEDTSETPSICVTDADCADAADGDKCRGSFSCQDGACVEDESADVVGFESVR